MEKETKNIHHPLEDVFNIEEGSTELTKTVNTELSTEVKPSSTKCDIFDDKDKEIEKQLEEVYTIAIGAYYEANGNSDVIEPRYRARNSEVAVQFLNTALTAIKEKSTLKLSKEKIEIDKLKVDVPGTLNQSIIVADRNSILKQLFGSSEDKIDTTDVLKND